MKHFIDVETTGLRKNYDDIIQICSIFTDDNYQIIDTYTKRFKSPKINSGILDLLGMTFIEYNKIHTCSFATEVKNIYDMLKQYNMVIYAYNQSFDRDMIKANLERYGYPVPNLQGINTMKTRMKLEENMIKRGYNLDEVMKFTKLYFPDARGFHDACFDTVCSLLIARDDKL